MSNDKYDETVRGFLEALAAGRCYCCGWPLAASKDNGCVPFNCAMRYREDTAHLAEREHWRRRATEVAALHAWALLGKPLPSANGARKDCCGAAIYKDPGGVEYPCGDCPHNALPSSTGDSTIRGLNCLLNHDMPCDALKEAREAIALLISESEKDDKEIDHLHAEIARLQSASGANPIQAQALDAATVLIRECVEGTVEDCTKWNRRARAWLATYVGMKGAPLDRSRKDKT